MTTWIVMAETEGNGEADRRLWSQTFQTKEAAEAARRFLESTEGARIAVIEDHVDLPASAAGVPFKK